MPYRTETYTIYHPVFDTNKYRNSSEAARYGALTFRQETASRQVWYDEPAPVAAPAPAPAPSRGGGGGGITTTSTAVPPIAYLPTTPLPVAGGGFGGDYKPIVPIKQAPIGEKPGYTYGTGTLGQLTGQEGGYAPRTITPTTPAPVAPRGAIIGGEYVPPTKWYAEQDYIPGRDDPSQKQVYDILEQSLIDKQQGASTTLQNIQDAKTRYQQALDDFRSIRSAPQGTTFTVTVNGEEKDLNKNQASIQYIRYIASLRNMINQEQKFVSYDRSLDEQLDTIRGYRDLGYEVKTGDGGYSFKTPKATTVYEWKHEGLAGDVGLATAQFLYSPFGVRTAGAGFQEYVLGQKGSMQAEKERLAEYGLGLEYGAKRGGMFDYVAQVTVSPAMIEGVYTPLLLYGGGAIIGEAGGAIAGSKLATGAGGKITTFLGKEGLSPTIARGGLSVLESVGSTGGQVTTGLTIYGLTEAPRLMETYQKRPEELGAETAQSIFDFGIGWAAFGEGIKAGKEPPSGFITKDIESETGVPMLREEPPATGYYLAQQQQIKTGEMLFKDTGFIEKPGARVPKIQATVYGVGTEEEAVIKGVQPKTIIKGKAIYTWDERIGVFGKRSRLSVRELSSDVDDIAKFGDITISSETGTVGLTAQDTRIAELIKRKDLLTGEEYFKLQREAGLMEKAPFQYRKGLRGEFFAGEEGIGKETIVGGEPLLPAISIRPTSPTTPIGASIRSGGELSELGSGSMYYYPMKSETLKHELVHSYREGQLGKAIDEFYGESKATKAIEEKIVRGITEETMYFTKTGEPISYQQFFSGLPRQEEVTTIEGLTRSKKLIELQKGRIDFAKTESVYTNIGSDVTGKQRSYTMVFTKLAPDEEAGTFIELLEPIKGKGTTPFQITQQVVPSGEKVVQEPGAIAGSISDTTTSKGSLIFKQLEEETVQSSYAPSLISLGMLTQMEYGLQASARWQEVKPERGTRSISLIGTTTLQPEKQQLGISNIFPPVEKTTQIEDVGFGWGQRQDVSQAQEQKQEQQQQQKQKQEQLTDMFTQTISITTPRTPRTIIPRPPPPVLGLKTEEEEYYGKKRRKKKEREFFSKKKSGEKGLLADILSVTSSQARYGKATQPRLTKGLWREAEKKLYLRVPTEEMMGESERPIFTGNIFGNKNKNNKGGKNVYF